MVQASSFLASDLSLIARGDALEGQSWIGMWRPESALGVPLVVGDFTAVDVAVYDLSNGAAGAPVFHDTPALATVVQAAPVVTADWQADPIGYTAIYTFDPAKIGPGIGAIGAREYVLVVTLTRTGGLAPKVCKLYVSLRGVPQ